MIIIPLIVAMGTIFVIGVIVNFFSYCVMQNQSFSDSEYSSSGYDADSESNSYLDY